MVFSPTPLYHKINPTPVKIVRGLFKSKSNMSENQTESRKVVRVFSSPLSKANEWQNEKKIIFFCFLQFVSENKFK